MFHEALLPFPSAHQRLDSTEKLVPLDHLFGHIRGDAGEQHALAHHAEQLTYRNVEVFFGQIAKAGVIDEIKRVVFEGKRAHVAEEIAMPPLRKRA